MKLDLLLLSWNGANKCPLNQLVFSWKLLTGQVLFVVSTSFRLFIGELWGVSLGVASEPVMNEISIETHFEIILKPTLNVKKGIPTRNFGNGCSSIVGD